jgi:hypothetical protein
MRFIAFPAQSQSDAKGLVERVCARESDRAALFGCYQAVTFESSYCNGLPSQSRRDICAAAWVINRTYSDRGRKVNFEKCLEAKLSSVGCASGYGISSIYGNRVGACSALPHDLQLYCNEAAGECWLDIPFHDRIQKCRPSDELQKAPLKRK